MTLHLVRNPDIIHHVVLQNKASFVVGFAAETHNVVHYAKEKLARKNLDMIIANQVGKGIGFESEENQVTILTKNKQLELPLTHKVRLAGQIIAILATTLHNAASQPMVH